MENNKSIHFIAVMVIIGTVIATAFGLFYPSQGTVHDFVNQYGDLVKINGSGLYKNDSYFMAPIARGTDFTFLFIGVPLFIVALINDIKKQIYKCRLFLLSVFSVFLYYSASICFGITYNFLHLLYIALFSLNLFGMILCFFSIDKKTLEQKVAPSLTTKGLIVFLIISGLSLFIAWLPDIIESLIKGRPLALIEIYTTQITYVLDMGIISPLIFICLYLIKKRNGIGYIILGMVLISCCLVGITVSAGTIFQYIAGIKFPLSVLITKVSIFIILAVFALMYSIKLYNQIEK